MEGLLEYSRQILGFLDYVAVFYKRLARACDVRLLENISAQKVAAYLTRDRDKRDRVGVGCGDTRNQVGSARTRGRDAYARNTARTAARVTARHMRGVLFLTDKDMLDGSGIINFVVERTNGRTRITKDDFHALSFQTLNHNFSSADHCVMPPYP